MLKIIFIFFVILFLFSCERENLITIKKSDIVKNVIDSTDAFNNCPPPYMDMYGFKLPKYGNLLPRVSSNGRKLAYSGEKFRILDLVSGDLNEVNIQGLMPKNIVFGSVYNIIWCPYDANKILLVCVTGTDTVGDGKNFVYGQKIFIYNLLANSIQNITPTIFGPSGADVNLSCLAWLKTSKEKRDLILIWHPTLYYPNAQLMKAYIPQENKFIDTDIPKGLTSQNGENTLEFFHIPNNIQTYYFYDGNIILFSPDFSSPGYFSWSPSGKQLALTLKPHESSNKLNDNRFTEIWLIDIEKFIKERPTLAPVKIINIRKMFCKYTFFSWCAEFLTDSTLAVSMHNDGDDFSPLWEITTDGRLVRQLTFSP